MYFCVWLLISQAIYTIQAIRRPFVHFISFAFYDYDFISHIGGLARKLGQKKIRTRD